MSATDPNPLGGAWGRLLWQLPDPASDPGVAAVHSLRIGYLGPGRVCEADVFSVFKPYILVLDLVWVGGGRLVDRLRRAASY